MLYWKGLYGFGGGEKQKKSKKKKPEVFTLRAFLYRLSQQNTQVVA
jgi:hypothetical protein